MVTSGGGPQSPAFSQWQQPRREQRGQGACLCVGLRAPCALPWTSAGPGCRASCGDARTRSHLFQGQFIRRVDVVGSRSGLSWQISIAVLSPFLGLRV